MKVESCIISNYITIIQKVGFYNLSSRLVKLVLKSYKILYLNYIS